MMANIEHQEDKIEQYDLQRVEAFREVWIRLGRELELYAQYGKAQGILQSTDVLEQMGLANDAEAPGENGSPQPTEVSMEALRLARHKVVEAMRHTLYTGTNKVKQYTELAKRVQGANPPPDPGEDDDAS